MQLQLGMCLRLNSDVTSNSQQVEESLQIETVVGHSFYFIFFCFVFVFVSSKVDLSQWLYLEESLRIPQNVLFTRFNRLFPLLSPLFKSKWVLRRIFLRLSRLSLVILRSNRRESSRTLQIRLLDRFNRHISLVFSLIHLADEWMSGQSDSVPPFPSWNCHRSIDGRMGYKSLIGNKPQHSNVNQNPHTIQSTFGHCVCYLTLLYWSSIIVNHQCIA